MGGRPVRKALLVSLFLFVLVAALQSAGSAALADDTSLGATGGSIRAVRSADARLATETVQAVCFGGFAEYRVDFRFVNEGKARKVKLGFPFTDTVTTEEQRERPVGFQAWKNARPLAVTAVPARIAGSGAHCGYFVHEAVFRHGATTITVSYLAEASATAGSYRRNGSIGDANGVMASWYQYWLHTGSTWKGPIGLAVVRYRFADSFRGRDLGLTADEAYQYARVTAPPHWTRPLARTIEWRFTDFEPKPAHASDWWKQQSRFDITLGFADPITRPSLQGRWTWSSVAGGFGQKGYTYLQDGSLGTCWAEGAPGPGVGQWAEARFKRPTRLRELRILPGNNAYDSAFTKFGRPRTLTAIFSDGSSTLLRLKDAPTLQRFPVDVRTRSVRFVVRSVRLGTDYPAACISEVEFGRERAPGYAPFGRLLIDPRATGRLTAWAGPAAPAPRLGRRTVDRQAARDDETYACGDLIGISDYEPFPADVAPFKEPASLTAITARDPAVRLPAEDVVGEPTTVSALSYWTYEIRYSSGIDLLVDIGLSGKPQVSLASELAEETKYLKDGGETYKDDRKQPFELVTIGNRVVGLARRGRVLTDCSGCSACVRHVPGQAFWRAGDASYHLYARSRDVSANELLAVARSMIAPESAEDQGSGASPWWWLAAGAATVGAVVAAATVMRRRRAARAGS